MHQSIETAVPRPRDIAGNGTFVQCYILNFSLPLGGNLAVTIPTPMVPVSGSLEDFSKLVSIINNRYGTLKGAIAAARFSYCCDC